MMYNKIQQMCINNFWIVWVHFSVGRNTRTYGNKLEMIIYKINTGLEESLTN